ncbi:transposase, MuDR, MULE transposase domain protein [Tanacetum coccineum]
MAKVHVYEHDIRRHNLQTAKTNIFKSCLVSNSEVEKGKIFYNKESLILVVRLNVRLKALNDGFQFLVDRSGPGRCELKCYCDWKLWARLWDNTGQYYITHLDDIHTCPKTQTYPNHRNANKKVITLLLTQKLQDRSRVLRGKDIQKDILEEYKIHVCYQQAWRGEDYGIQQIRGSPYEAFEMLPYYCYNLEQKNEGTVTRIKTDKKGVFEMLFIAIGASICTFLNSLRLVLMIDAAHLKVLYKGKNLVVVAMDGNNQIVPIAFGIYKGETGPCWSWWMSVLKECIGDNPNLLFISDRHAAIALAVENDFPLAFHVVCCRHLMMNLSLKNKKRKDLFWKICKPYTREDFATNMNILQIVQHDAYKKLCDARPQRWSSENEDIIRQVTQNDYTFDQMVEWAEQEHFEDEETNVSCPKIDLSSPDAYKKLCEAGPQRWLRAHCSLVRYNYMTSNSVESVNARSVIYRKEPVLKLAERYRAMVQQWFTSPPGREFVGEMVATVDPVELDTFSTDQVKLILTNSLGYDKNSSTFLYIKKPNCSFDSGLVPLADAIQERDMILMYTHHNRLHVYVSRVELSPLVVAEQHKDETNKTENQGKPSWSNNGGWESEGDKKKEENKTFKASLGGRVLLLLIVSRKCAARSGGIPSMPCSSVPLRGCDQYPSGASNSPSSSTSSLE